MSGDKLGVDASRIDDGKPGDKGDQDGAPDRSILRRP
jgi:hypothetical protein